MPNADFDRSIERRSIRSIPMAEPCWSTDIGSALRRISSYHNPPGVRTCTLIYSISMILLIIINVIYIFTRPLESKTRDMHRIFHCRSSAYDVYQYVGVLNFISYVHNVKVYFQSSVDVVMNWNSSGALCLVHIVLLVLVALSEAWQI